MAADHYIAARVSADTKARLGALAAYQDLSESACLKRLVDLALLGSGAGADDGPRRSQGPRDARLYVRLRPEDQLLIRERAAARCIPIGTYASMALRAHLRHVAPLPKEELAALKRSIAELGAIGRNLNQLARAANQGMPGSGLGAEHARSLLKVCQGLRDHVKALVHANAASWDTGHAGSRR